MFGLVKKLFNKNNQTNESLNIDNNISQVKGKAMFGSPSETDDWVKISKSGNVSYECMRECKNKLDWVLLSAHQELTGIQMKEFQDVINFSLQKQHFGLPKNCEKYLNITTYRIPKTVTYTSNKLTLLDKNQHDGDRDNGK